MGEGDCFHDFPDRMTLADYVAKDGKFTIASYCFECNHHRSKKINTKEWTAEALLKLRKNQYHVYSTLEEISTLRNFIEIKLHPLSVINSKK